MIACADVLAEWLDRRSLSELHGLRESELARIMLDALGEFPSDRWQCGAVAFEAIRSAMADYRQRRLEEFQGEEALICTCFGISESTIESVISANSLSDIDQVADICRAGSGCGSCRMLIQELMDVHSDGV